MSLLNEPAQVSQRNTSFFRSLKTVAWGFLGVRKNSEYQQDLASVNPFHIVIAGIVAALLFVGVLLAIVKWVVAT